MKDPQAAGVGTEGGALENDRKVGTISSQNCTGTRSLSLSCFVSLKKELTSLDLCELLLTCHPFLSPHNIGENPYGKRVTVPPVPMHGFHEGQHCHGELGSRDCHDRVTWQRGHKANGHIAQEQQ